MCKPPRKMPDAMPVITILMFLNTSLLSSSFKEIEACDLFLLKTLLTRLFVILYFVLFSHVSDFSV